MAIALEYLDFIVPIETIKAKYPGGWAACLSDHDHLIAGRVWYDDHLFRDGAMSPQDIEHIVTRWQSLGFEPDEERDGMRCWKDVCVVSGPLCQPTLPCDWLEVDENGRVAWFMGTERGDVVGRD